MLNRVIIAGRMVKEPDLRETKDGKAVASFAVAVERDFKNKEGVREVDFLECEAWRQTAEFVSKYFNTGDMIIVDGRLMVNKWTDKSGNSRKSVDIIVDNAYFGGKNNSVKAGDIEITEIDSDDKLPF